MNQNQSLQDDIEQQKRTDYCTYALDYDEGIDHCPSNEIPAVISLQSANHLQEIKILLVRTRWFASKGFSKLSTFQKHSEEQDR